MKYIVNGTYFILFVLLLHIYVCISIKDRVDFQERSQGDDEPHIVSWRVLEGVIEPFDQNNPDEIPAWKHLKDAADKKAADMQLQQALSSYNHLLKHKYLFGGMPLEARYDVFLSMARILKVMGFHQKAELLLYESISYMAQPREAHLQLGLLALDREDLNEAAMHFKNCLFYKADDVQILTNLAVVLIAEGKMFEAKYFVSRLLSALEIRVRKLLHFMGREQGDLVRITARAEQTEVARWLEDIALLVMHGEFRVTPSANLEMVKMFSNVYTLLGDGALSGRFEFDLGQTLYEGGYPRIGYLMMQRGHETSNIAKDGRASSELVQLRLAMDYPIVPGSVTEIMQRYFNMTTFLARSADTFLPMAIDNLLDIFWPLPLLHWAGLSMYPVVRELLWRFNDIPLREDPYGRHFLGRLRRRTKMAPPRDNDQTSMKFRDKKNDVAKRAPILSHQPPEPSPALEALRAALGEDYQHDTVDVIFEGRTVRLPKSIKKDLPSQDAAFLSQEEQRRLDGAEIHASRTGPVVVEVGVFGGHFNSHPVGQDVLMRILGFRHGKSHLPGASRFHITLLALPLVPDEITQLIAKSVHRIVNLPIDSAAAWEAIEALHLDVILVPDWQPFPDQLTVLFSSARMAPIQVCVFVRGGGCLSAGSMDYYLLPEELDILYFKQTPAISAVQSDQIYHIDESQASYDEQNTSHHRYAWLEPYAEQVVLVSDWPIITRSAIQDIAARIMTAPSGLEQLSSGMYPDGYGNRRGSIPGLAEVLLPEEADGHLSFNDAPVALMVVHPSQLHPLMDELLLKLLNAVPKLNLVLTLPSSHFSHSNSRGESRKMCWARALIRRLWKRGGGLHPRIRLLPSPSTDARLLQLFKQADVVLDTFPLGMPAYYASLALSVGSPIVTLRTGTQLHTPKADLQAIHTWLGIASRDLQMSTVLKKHPLVQLLRHGEDIPWSATTSTLCGFFIGTQLTDLIANSTAEYFYIASRLLQDKELAYHTRVRILDAIDAASVLDQPSVHFAASSAQTYGSETAGLWDFVYRAGEEWANVRYAFMATPSALAAIQAHADEVRTRRKRRSHATE